jgi:hypothetical protein
MYLYKHTYDCRALSLLCAYAVLKSQRPMSRPTEPLEMSEAGTLQIL